MKTPKNDGTEKKASKKSSRTVNRSRSGNEETSQTIKKSRRTLSLLFCVLVPGTWVASRLVTVVLAPGTRVALPQGNGRDGEGRTERETGTYESTFSLNPSRVYFGVGLGWVGVSSRDQRVLLLV